MSELQIELPQATPLGDASGVFVLHVRSALSAVAMERIRQVWRATWGSANRKPPELLILENSATLSELSDADLRKHGLVRVHCADSESRALLSAAG